jgi:RNA polymerase sigma-70 factor (ECF subfamily)
MNMSSRPASTDFDSLFREYYRDLGAFAYGRLRDRDAASDLVQDTFVRYIAHTQKAPVAPEAPRFFLWRIASNLILDLARRERRRGQMLPIDDAAALDISDARPSAEQQVAARQEFLILKRALSDLPKNQRTALLWNRVEGLTHAQIAARIGVSASMVNKYIASALSHCAARLAAAGL